MFRNDYIIRMIEQIADVLRFALFHRSAGRYDDSRRDIEQGYALLGLNRQLARSLPPERLLWLLRRTGPNFTPCILLAQLLTEDGRIAEETLDIAAARLCYQTAQGILQTLQDELTANQDEEPETENEQAYHKVQELLGEVAAMLNRLPC